MVKIIDEGPHESVVKRIVCRNCGATLEYTPNDVRSLGRWRDISQTPSGKDGFTCPKCSKEVVTKSW